MVQSEAFQMGKRLGTASHKIHEYRSDATEEGRENLPEQ